MNLTCSSFAGAGSRRLRSSSPQPRRSRPFIHGTASQARLALLSSSLVLRDRSLPLLTHAATSRLIRASRRTADKVAEIFDADQAPRNGDQGSPSGAQGVREVLELTVEQEFQKLTGALAALTEGGGAAGRSGAGPLAAQRVSSLGGAGKPMSVSAA